ncbi:MAG TPA: hypothetical protein VFV79_10340, partial [Saprospiraceae bacterium]|nr:hypothetical protein [Saprospiraceae bacterium]
MKNKLFILTIMFANFLMASCKKETGPSTAADAPMKPDETAAQADPLTSWHDGEAKKALFDFVINATKEGSSGFIPPADRIAVFDNDGTLWSEQPFYFQFFYSVDKIKQLAPQHPEWKKKEPFKSVLAGNLKGALASGEKGLMAMMGATFGGMS